LPTKLVVASQVKAYQAKLGPEPRRHLKLAIHGLAEGKGDIKALSDNLEGFHRLRLGTHRVIFRYQGARIECLYAAPRTTVYEFLAAHFREMLEE
jgi:mRNA-degrading endonuclease RelE of RelBE toxin-antitoxin system